MNAALSRFAIIFFFLRKKRKEGWKRTTESSAQELLSERNWRLLQWWACPGVPGDLLGSAIWEEHEPVDTLRMGLNLQIPFAAFLFGSLYPWLSLPPASLSWAIKWGWGHVPVRSTLHQLMEHLPVSYPVEVIESYSKVAKSLQCIQETGSRKN